MNETNDAITWFMPDGRPCPAVLTADEVVVLLRLPNQNALNYYRGRKMIRGTRLGRYVRFSIDEVRRFIREQEDR